MIKKKINRFLALSLTAMMIVTSVPITTVASEETEVSTESETQSKEEEENNDDAEGNGDEVNAEEGKKDNSSSEGRQETSSNDDNSGEESSTESADVSSGEVESVVDTVTDSETDITDDVVDNTNTEEVNTTEIGVEETTETESSTEQTTESLTEVETETESTTEIEQTTESLTDVETETETESTTEVETETIEEETTTEELELEFEYTYKDNDQHTKHCVNDESVEDVTEDCAYPAEANKDGDFICELCGNVKEDKQTESSEVTFKVTFKEGDEVVKEQEITANIDDEVKLELPDGYQTGDDLSVIVKAEQEDIIINVTKIEKEPVEFDVLDGITDDYVLADGGDLTFRIDADIDTFQRLLVDGGEVSSEQYSVKSGSTIITIKESFMQTLDAGQHTVRSEFDEGFAEVKFNIVERTEYLIKFFALREKESQEKSDGEDEPVNALKESTSEMVDASNNATGEETSSKDKYEYEEVFSIMTTDGKIDYFPSVMIYEFATPKGIWVVGEDGDTEVNNDTVFEKDTCIYMTYDFIEEQEDDGEFDVSFWILVDINDADLTDEVKEAVFENGDENNNEGLPHYIYTKLETIRTVNGKVERFPKITAKVPEWAGNWCLKNDDGEYSEKINEEYLFTEDTDVWAEYIMPAVDYELGDGDVLLDNGFGTAVWNESTGVLKIYAVKIATSNYPWSSIAKNVREAYAIGDITKFKSCYWLFKGMSNMIKVDVSQLDTTSITEMTYMFSGCRNLTEIVGLENIDTSSVKNMSSMFYNCSSIESLNIGSWDTSNVINFTAMFEDCNSLTSLDVSSWNTSNVTNMHYLFNTCSALTSLDVSSWDTSNVTDMTGMFYNCSSLTSINVSGFNTNNVKSMTNMFKNCSGLTTIDLSSFSTDSLTVAVGILDGCTKLTKIKTPTSTKALGLTLPRTSQGYWHDEEDDVDITTNKYNLQSTSHTLTFHYSVKSKVPASITAEVSTPIIIDEKEEVPTDNITVKVTYDVVYTDDSTDTLEEEITPPNANLAITPSPVTYGTTEITLTYTEDGESVQTTLPVTVNCLHENITTSTITEATYFNAGEEQDICDQCGDVTATRTVNKLIDTTAPEIEIKVADNSWKSFLNTVTFGLAYKDRQEAKITIKDDESQIIEASYWLLKFTDRQAKDGVQLAVSGQVDGDWSQYYNAKLLVNGVEKSRTGMIFIGSVTADWTRKTQTRTINLADINEYIVVVRAVDSQGNYAWASSNGVIVDSQKPAVFWTYISNGVEVWVDMGAGTTISRDDYDYKCVGAISNGQWKVAVEDETLRKIVVSKDGTEIESIDIKSGGDGKDDTTIMNNVFRKDYSSNGYGMYKVVATDSAGNTTTSTFKYSENNHAYGAQTVEWSEDNSEVTFKRVCADSSEHILTETVSTTYTEITAPTCENKGEGTYTATPTKAGLTSVTKTVDVDATGHDWNTPTYTWSVDNTTVDASTECKNDATHTVSEKANVEHKITLAPTCDTDGEEALTAEFTKEPFTTQTKNSTKIDKLGHNYGDLTVKTEPKLDGTKAVLEHICDRCDKSEAFDEVSRVVTSVEIVPDRFNVYDGEKPDIGDIESIKITLEVTFNDTDSTTKSFTFETTIDNIADNGDVDIDNDGTPDINVDIEDKIPVDGDTVDVTVKIPTDGTDKTDIKQIPVDVIEHIFSNEWTIDKQPTCTEDGEKSHHCTDEGYEELKSDVTVIPALGHDYESEITTKPELDGTVAVKTYTCKRCGDKKTTTETVRVVKDVVIEPNKVELLEDNKPDNDDIPNINVTITVTFDDGTEEDFEFNIDPSDADNNGDIDVDGDGDVDANIDIDYTEPIADGDEIKITIKIPEDGTTDVIEEKLPIEIVEHKFSTEWIVDKAPTCTEEGIESRHCLDAGYEDLKIDERVIPALGHDWATYTISDLTLEDYTAKVVKTYECSRCDATQTTTEINRTIIKIDVEPNPIEKIEGQPIKEEDIDKIKITIEVEFDDGTKEEITIETTPDKDEVEIDIPDGTDGLPIGNNEINISITVPKDEGEEIVVPVKVTVVKKKKPSNNTANNSFNSDNNNNRSNGVNVYRMVDVHIAGLLVGQTGCSVTVNSPKKSYDVSDDGYYRISSIAVGETKINYYINNQKEEVASITLTTDYSGRIYDIRVTKVTEGFNIELLTDKDTTNRLIVHLTTDAFMETRSELYKVETLPEDGIINEEALDNPRVFVGDASADEMSRFNNLYFTEIDKSYDHTVDVGKSQFSVLKLWENPFTGSVQLGEPVTIEEDIVKHFTVNLSGNADVVIQGEKRHTVNSLSDVAVDSDEMHKNYVSVSDRSMLSQKFVDTVNISNIEKIKNSDTIFDKENPAIYIIIVFVMLAIILVTAFVKRSNNSDEEQ